MTVRLVDGGRWPPFLRARGLRPGAHGPAPSPSLRMARAPRPHPMSVSPSVRVQLALRSGNRCAMPACDRLLSTADATLIGEAAHIAGEHGGQQRGRASARFDPTMTKEERNSLSNLLYLCRNCHARIDSIPRGERDFPVQRLLEIKSRHEAAVAAAMEDAVGSVTFAELEIATRWVVEEPLPARDLDFSRIPIDAKIRKHKLSVASRNLILSHLVVATQVRSFIQNFSLDDAGFPDRLKSGFLSHYHRLRRDGISSGQELFDLMCVFARRGFHDINTQYAAQAVLTYLFETCDVFEP